MSRFQIDMNIHGIVRVQLEPETFGNKRNPKTLSFQFETLLQFGEFHERMRNWKYRPCEYIKMCETFTFDSVDVTSLLGTDDSNEKNHANILRTLTKDKLEISVDSGHFNEYFPSRNWNEISFA